MIIGIDFNNCIQDQIGRIIFSSGNLLTRQDFDQWDPPIGYKLGLSEEEFINFAWKNEALQMEAIPFTGASEAINRLVEMGHVVKIVTSTLLTPSKLVYWLDRWNIPFHQIIFTQNKSVERLDLLIDDSPKVLSECINLGKPVLKFEIPWNKNVNCPGFSTWDKLDECIHEYIPINTI